MVLLKERRRARLRLPHELREPEGRRARRANPHAALLFHWQPLGRQVRVEGRVERFAAEESEAYFRTRPLGSRLAAWASPQSRPLADRAELERLYAEAQRALRRGRAAAADTGAASASSPDAYEFWQHGDDRLHDRVRYERDGDGWSEDAARALVLEERARRVVRVGVAGLPGRSTRLPSTSRIPTIPSRWPPSTTGTWRILRSPISRAASRIWHVGVDGDRLPRHHVADVDRVEVGAVTREGEDVALGEDADEPAAVADGDRADAFLEHPQHRQAGGVARLDRHDTRPHHVADRHGCRV